VGSLNITCHPDGKRFVLFPAAIKSEQNKGNLHVTSLRISPTSYGGAYRSDEVIGQTIAHYRITAKLNGWHIPI
jgi:hypothetical protein